MWTERRLDANEPFFIFFPWCPSDPVQHRLGRTTSFSPKPERWSCDNSQEMSDFDNCRFILIRMAYITDRLVSMFAQDLMWHLTSLPWESVVSLIFGKCVISYQLICRGKTTNFSSEPARWSCDNCQRMSDFDTCQSILIRMVYITDRLVSIFEQDLMWHLTSAYM